MEMIKMEVLPNGPVLKNNYKVCPQINAICLGEKCILHSIKDNIDYKGNFIKRGPYCNLYKIFI